MRRACGSLSHVSLLEGVPRRMCRLSSCRAVTSARRFCLEAFTSCGEDLVGPCFFECMSVSSVPMPIALSL